LDQFIDIENDTPQEILEKRALSTAFSKPAEFRSKYDLKNLCRFFTQFKFFKDIQ